MSTPAQRKGAQFERDVVAYLNAYGGGALVRTKAGQSADRGDIAGDPEVAYECRNRQRYDIWQALRDAQRHASAAHKPIGVAVLKQPYKPVGEAMVVMSLADYVLLRNSDLRAV